MIDIINDKITEYTARIETLNRMAAWYKNNEEKFIDIAPTSINPLQLGLDYDNLSHEDVMRVIKAVGGKWDKAISQAGGNRIDYTTEVDGYQLRCWAGKPPETCKLVEKTRVIPAQPEREEKYFELVCKE